MTNKLNLSNITQNYKELIENFENEKNKLSDQFEEIFEEEIVQLINKLPSIKSLTWTQTTKWEGGMTFDFQVNEIAFLSFELNLYNHEDEEDDFDGDYDEIHKYPSNYKLPTKKDFVIDSLKSLKKSSLSEEEKTICTQIFEIFKTNKQPLEKLFGENIAGYVTKNGVHSYDYED